MEGEIYIAAHTNATTSEATSEITALDRGHILALPISFEIMRIAILGTEALDIEMRIDGADPDTIRFNRIVPIQTAIDVVISQKLISPEFF